MPENIKIEEGLYASQYVKSVGRKIDFRGTQFPNVWADAQWTTEQARKIFEYGIALCDEIDNPPREWVEGATYTTNHPRQPSICALFCAS